MIYSVRCPHCGNWCKILSGRGAFCKCGQAIYIEGAPLLTRRDVMFILAVFAPALAVLLSAIIRAVK